MSSWCPRTARPRRWAGAGGPRNDETWRDLAKVTAQMQTVFVVLVNRVGVEDGINFFGASMVIDPLGGVVARARDGSEDLVVCDLHRPTPAACAHLLPIAPRRAPAGPASRDGAPDYRAIGTPRTGWIVKIFLIYKCHDLGRMEFYSRFTRLGLAP